MTIVTQLFPVHFTTMSFIGSSAYINTGQAARKYFFAKFEKPRCFLYSRFQERNKQINLYFLYAFEKIRIILKTEITYTIDK